MCSDDSLHVNGNGRGVEKVVRRDAGPKRGRRAGRFVRASEAIAHTLLPPPSLRPCAASHMSCIVLNT
jgi:hypothetical protein